MSMSANLHDICKAKAYAENGHEWVWVMAQDGDRVTLHLPAGTAQSVADAINAAVNGKINWRDDPEAIVEDDRLDPRSEVEF